MKYLVLVLMCFLFVGCKSSEVKPQPPIIVVPPPPPPPPAMPEYCVKGDKKFNCGNPVWYKLDKCSATDDGTAYFASLADIEAMFKAQGVPTKVTMKDTSVVWFGFGFAAPCFEM